MTTDRESVDRYMELLCYLNVMICYLHTIRFFGNTHIFTSVFCITVPQEMPLDGKR